MLDKKPCQIRQAKRSRRKRAESDIRVFSVGKSLKIESFKIPENSLDVGRAWKEWIEDFEDETSHFKITQLRPRERPKD